MADDFDPDAYLAKVRAAPMQPAGNFDPDAYLAKAKGSLPASAPATSTGMAGLEGTGQGLSLGYLPQLQAAAEPATDFVLYHAWKHGLIPGLDADKAPASYDDFKKSKGAQNYVARRDENIARMGQEKADHPVAFTGGQAAGSLVGGLATGGLGEAAMGGQAATAAGRIGQAAVTGAALGAASNPGDVRGELSPLQLGDRAQNAAIGGAMGGAIGGAFEGGKAALTNASEGLGNFAEEKAFKSIGPLKKDFLKAIKDDNVSDFGRHLLDTGVVGPLTSPAAAAERLSTQAESAGQNIGNIIEAADKGGLTKVDPKAIAQQLLDDPEVQALAKTPGQEGTATRVKQMIDTLSQNDEMSVAQAQKLRQGIDQMINYNKTVPEMQGVQPYAYKMRSALRDAMNDAVNAHTDQFDTVPKDVLNAANKKYAMATNLDQIATAAQARNSANRAFGLTDTIASGAGTAAGAAIAGPVGAALGGVAGGGLNKVARTFGPALQANMADLASNGMNAMAQDAGPATKALTGAGVDRIRELLDNYKAGKANEKGVNQGLMNLLSSNPGLIDNIQNPELKNQLKRQMPGQDRVPQQEKYVPEQQARDQFLKGN